ncbi:MAG: glycosyltransferase family 4 protein [Faecalibacterium sp.]|jgi:glycosyltransferase involved in cell wall biosynthesis|nr:glycosyltransferase family 4 protein [Faecalibacterium sp.]
MKVLWYVNIVLPAAAAHFGFGQTNGGGWLEAQATQLAQSGVQLSILHATPLVKKPQRAALADGITYLLVPPSADQTHFFGAALDSEKPDLVHIFGTEYAYNLAMAAVCRAAHQPYVVSIQGIMAECARHYADGLPARYARVDPLIRLMKKVYYADSIALAQQEFAARGKAESEMLPGCPYLIGRTAWDKAYLAEHAPQAYYFSINENLRAPFYSGERWAYDACRPHSIFVSQAFYPIKGFHQLLKILPALIARYPDLKVYVGGQKAYSLGNALLDAGVDRFFEYQRYLKQQIKAKGLAPYLTFLGPLSAEQMKQQYLASNVFLSPSTVENSPNSVGEAMLLGVPVAASRVGGTPSLLTDGQDGILYDFEDLAAMQAAVCRLFDDPAAAAAYGARAAAHAAKTHDRTQNTKELLEAYEQILHDSMAKENP